MVTERQCRLPKPPNSTSSSPPSSPVHHSKFNHVSWKIINEPTPCPVHPLKSSIDKGKGFPIHDIKLSPLPSSDQTLHVQYLSRDTQKKKVLESILQEIRQTSIPNSPVMVHDSCIKTSSSNTQVESCQDSTSPKGRLENLPLMQEVLSTTDTNEIISKRPPSPFILWESCSQIKIAKDVPLDLLRHPPTLLGLSGSPQCPFPTPKPTVYKTQREVKPFSLHDSSSMVKKDLRKEYGVWYLPPQTWNSNYCKRNNELGGTSTNLQSPVMRDQINGLFISKEYKKHIKSAGLRLPKYLDNDVLHNNRR